MVSEQPDVLLDLKHRLEKRIADARGVIAQSERELVLVQQALAARSGEPLPATADERSSVVDTGRERKSDGRFHGIPRKKILAVASTVPSPITPPRVVDAFAERGIAVTLEQIRIALNRLAKDGSLTKVGASLFAVPEGEAPEGGEAHGAGTNIPDDPFVRPVLGPPVSRDAFRRTA